MFFKVVGKPPDQVWSLLMCWGSSLRGTLAAPATARCSQWFPQSARGGDRRDGCAVAQPDLKTPGVVAAAADRACRYLYRRSWPGTAVRSAV